MFDFRLQVFHTVAKRLNFTKASTELFISQPAVTKHIKELEEQFKTTLIERSGNKKISLTPAGEMLLAYADRLAAVYNELDFDMNLLIKKHSGTLRIGGSNTVAQYVIPPVLARFHEKFKDVQVNLVPGNTEQVEQALLNKEIDLGIVEGILRNPQLSYQEFLSDELVLICSASNTFKKDSIKPEELIELPLLLREPGSGTLDVIAHALKPFNIKLSDLKIEMQLGGTESIKSYLLHSKCFAFVSVQSILKELKYNECRIIDIKDLTIERPFYFILPHGQPSSLAEIFMRFAKSYKSL
ncbi:LysR substrate-binding domain-containing protein [Mucilaginibacter sp. SMC90]|uniref:LysR substrate-binding domain-containing protein n=1 Tax=Mucilaginibacter TaxID=423349 RepID=UPI00131BAC9B|nr:MULTISPECIES: LysR substrate-binding domain-containing protein [unclassified Mucilaginibacter]MBS7565691.1 LysR family transcriptional regulator [Mucilaginibacter sp. Bleaf8]UOE49847.1 LysR substrate-binding domain-containing protein [Mucilaginibacter sp. SMC90]